DADTLPKRLNPWIDLGVVHEMHVIENKRLIYSYPSGHRSPPSVVNNVNPPPVGSAHIDFNQLLSEGFIYAWSIVPGTDALIVAAFRPADLTERINPVQDSVLTHSYAFDRRGWPTNENSAQSSHDEQARFPASLLRVSEHPERAAVQMGEYLGRQNKEVVGAWTWLSEYDIGIATEIPQ